jgi:predicted RNA-binding Zn-ribbon protein involved in translation (DUF1610 family)
MNAAIDQHWWFDLTCPKCGHKPAWVPRAEVVPTERGGSISLSVEQAICTTCGYVLTTGDEVTLCHDVGSETVERRTYRIPQERQEANG